MFGRVALFVSIGFLVFAPAASQAQVLERVAYIGDSQTGAPGVPIIGAALSCLDRKNIIGFGNARATTYVGGGRCRLFGSIQGESVDLCRLAPRRFRQILQRDSQEIDTVVVALGDNPSEAGFEKMLSAITHSGKKCIWVMPAKKVGNNTNTMLARRTLKPIAERVCGRENIIDPSEDGTRFQTCESDHVHYLPSAGRRIARRICQALEDGVPCGETISHWSGAKKRMGAFE